MQRCRGFGCRWPVQRRRRPVRLASSILHGCADTARRDGRSVRPFPASGSIVTSDVERRVVGVVARHGSSLRIEDALRSDHHGGTALERLAGSVAPAISQAATSAFHTFGKVRWRNVWPDSSGRSRADCCSAGSAIAARLPPVTESGDAGSCDGTPTAWTLVLGRVQLGPHDSGSVARCTRWRRHTELVAPRRNRSVEFVCDQRPGRADISSARDRVRRLTTTEGVRRSNGSRSRHHARSPSRHLSEGPCDQTKMIVLAEYIGVTAPCLATIRIATFDSR